MIFAILLLFPVAFGTTYNVRFCAEYDVSYDDADPSFGDDFVTSNGTYPAAGAYIKVIRNSDSYVMRYEATEEKGVNAGCFSSTLAVESTQQYSVKVKSIASIDGNTIHVYTDDSTWGVYSYGPSMYTPLGGTKYTITTPTGAEEWNIAYAAAHSAMRESVGLAGEDFVFFNDSYPGGGSACHDYQAYISSLHTDNKYAISHEFGHCLAQIANGSTSSHADDTAFPDNCYTDADTGYGHEWNSKEYQSNAFWEGLAYYYAAVAYNDTSEANCTFVSYKRADWDLDSTVEGTPTFAVSCETYPATAPSANYLENYCDEPFTNRGIEYDWLRFFWDLTTDQGLTPTEVFEIMDLANPDTWNSNGDGYDSYTDSTPCSPTPSYPTGRLRCAAYTMGYLTEWDAEDNTNGVYR